MFPQIFISYCSICSTLSTRQVFPEYYFYELCFELLQNVNVDRWNNARDQHEFRHKWGKIGPSHLLNENGDLSFLLYFSKQPLVENIQGECQENSSVTFISEESP